MENTRYEEYFNKYINCGKEFAVLCNNMDLNDISISNYIHVDKIVATHTRKMERLAKILLGNIDEVDYIPNLRDAKEAIRESMNSLLESINTNRALHEKAAQLIVMSQLMGMRGL